MRKYYYTKKKNGLDLICNICGRVIFLKRIKVCLCIVGVGFAIEVPPNHVNKWC